MQPLGCIGGQGTLFFHVDVGFFCFLVSQGLAERRANADQKVFGIHIYQAEHLRLPDGVVCSRWCDGEGDTRQSLQAFQDSAQCGTADTKAEDIGQFSGCGGNRQTGGVLRTKFQVESIACFLHFFVRVINANPEGSAWYGGQIKHGEKNPLILDAQALGWMLPTKGVCLVGVRDIECCFGTLATLNGAEKTIGQAMRWLYAGVIENNVFDYD